MWVGMHAGLPRDGLGFFFEGGGYGGWGGGKYENGCQRIANMAKRRQSVS